MQDLSQCRGRVFNNGLLDQWYTLLDKCEQLDPSLILVTIATWAENSVSCNNKEIYITMECD